MDWREKKKGGFYREGCKGQEEVIKDKGGDNENTDMLKSTHALSSFRDKYFRGDSTASTNKRKDTQARKAEQKKASVLQKMKIKNNQ
jgi:hypothetical protein